MVVDSQEPLDSSYQRSLELFDYRDLYWLLLLPDTWMTAALARVSNINVKNETLTVKCQGRQELTEKIRLRTHEHRLGELLLCDS